MKKAEPKWWWSRIRVLEWRVNGLCQCVDQMIDIYEEAFKRQYQIDNKIIENVKRHTALIKAIVDDKEPWQ